MFTCRGNNTSIVRAQQRNQIVRLARARPHYSRFNPIHSINTTGRCLSGLCRLVKLGYRTLFSERWWGKTIRLWGSNGGNAREPRYNQIEDLVIRLRFCFPSNLIPSTSTTGRYPPDTYSPTAIGSRLLLERYWLGRMPHLQANSCGSAQSKGHISSIGG